MEDLCRDLLRKAACGFLVQGHVHNMSGPLQILSMQVELMKTLFERIPEADPAKTAAFIQDQQKKLDQIASQVERLRALLASISEVTEELPTTLDLNEVLQKELVFWEGDLVFKHEVSKELDLSPEPLLFYASPAAINQGLCALFWGFIPALSENRGSLRVTTEKQARGPKATISLTGIELASDNPFFEIASELLSPYGKVVLQPQTISLEFQKK